MHLSQEIMCSLFVFFSLYIGCSSKLTLAICGFIVSLNVRNASNAI